MQHDIAALENKLQAIEHELCRCRDAKHTETLRAMIRRPGWTTVAEAALVHSHLDSLHNHAIHLQNSFDAVVKAAEKIGPN